MKAYFLSDVHIMGPDDPKLDQLIGVVGKISDDATHIGLLGDIFDLWVCDHDYFAKMYSPFVDAVKSAVDKGIKVHYVEGNHDFHLKGFWQEKVGVQVHENSHTIDSDGVKIRLEHGDYINPDDLAYFFWRDFTRGSLMKGLMQGAPGSWVQNVGEFLSKQSRKRSRREYTPAIKADIIKKIETYSVKCAQKFEFDYLISGHVHVETEFTFTANGKVRKSVNLGFWDKPKVYRVSGSESGFLRLDS
jgi:UDP-2,3-diacylglucosamine hydrolase